VLNTRSECLQVLSKGKKEAGKLYEKRSKGSRKRAGMGDKIVGVKKKKAKA
jgi:hypothetical protein